MTTIVGSALLALFLPWNGVAQAYTYNDSGVYNRSQHPYDVRTDMLNRRKKRAEIRRKIRDRYISTDALYNHPGYTKVAELHPYYRNGPGTLATIPVAEPFEHWKNRQRRNVPVTELDKTYIFGTTYRDTLTVPSSVVVTSVAPEAKCMNYTFEKPHYRAKPLIEECY